MFKKRKRTKSEDVGEATSKERPNLFLALQIADPNIVERLRNVQNVAMKDNDKLKEVAVSAEKSHVTTHVFNADEDKLHEVREAVEKAVEDCGGCGGALELRLRNVRDFSKRVIHVEVEVDEGFKPLNERIRRRLDDVGHVKNVQNAFESPHVTLFKSSRAKKFKLKKAKIDLTPFERFRDEDFGVQKCGGIQLLSMLKPPQNDYYFKFFEVPFIEKSSRGEKADVCEPKPAALTEQQKCIIRVKTEKVQRTDVEKPPQNPRIADEKTTLITKAKSESTSSSSLSPLTDKMLRLTEFVTRNPKTLLISSIIAFAAFKVYHQYKCNHR